MIERRRFLTGLASGLAAAVTLGTAALADVAGDVVAQLEAQGFSAIEVTSTWLGRVRIRANRDGGVREIVLNPRSGEILRDIWIAADGTSQVPTIVDDVSSGGSGSDDGGSDGGDSGDDGGEDSSGGDSGSSGGSSDDSSSDDSGTDN